MIAVVAIASVYYLSRTSAAQAEGALTASGTVEAVEITVAAEIGGRVVEVLAHEGDAVAAGDALVRLDDTALQAQLAQARAALAVAQTNYDLVAAGAPSLQPGAGPATPTPEQLAVAEAQVDLAAAAVAVPTAAVIGVLTRFAISRYTASPIYAGTTVSQIGFRTRRSEPE